MMVLLLLALLSQSGGPQALARESELRQRLARVEVGFDEANELMALVEDWGRDAEGEDARARYALYALQALKRAADAADPGAFGTPFALALGEESPRLAYDEIGGRWMVRHDHIFGVHDAYRGTPPADAIAWFAVENGLGGECEGYVPCDATRRDRLEGEYLRRHPGGRHAQEALEAIATLGDATVLAGLDSMGVPRDVVCADLQPSLEALTSAVAGVVEPARSAARRAAQNALTQLGALCR